MKTAHISSLKEMALVFSVQCWGLEPASQGPPSLCVGVLGLRTEDTSCPAGFAGLSCGVWGALRDKGKVKDTVFCKASLYRLATPSVLMVMQGIPLT